MTQTILVSTSDDLYKRLEKEQKMRRLKSMSETVRFIISDWVAQKDEFTQKGS